MIRPRIGAVIVSRNDPLKSARRIFGRRDVSISLRAQQQIIAIGAGMVGLETYLWQLSVPIFLQLYDSGVYLAASIDLVTGTVPYRDFSFVQPPGILLVLSPIAEISRVVGTHDGYILARVLTALVTAANASLLSWLVRYRGRVAMAVAGVGLALTPVAVFYSSAIRLEPYCFFLVLLGSISLVGAANNASLTSRAVARGGVFFGLAAAIEFWAFFPFLAMAICLLGRERRQVARFVGWTGFGLALPLLPFVVAVPRSFVREVFLEQLGHPRSGGDILRRLVDITGFSGTALSPSGFAALAIFSLFALLIAITFRRRTTEVFGDHFLLLAAAISVIGLLAAPAAYTDYGYFAAPFLWGLAAVVIARSIVSIGNWIGTVRLSQVARRIITALGAAAATVLLIAMVSFVTTFYSLYLPLTGVSSAAIEGIARAIPRNSCVIYDTVGIGLLANRFQTGAQGCPKVVDPFGMSMGWGFQRKVPARQYVVQWQSYLEAARYLVVAVPIVESAVALTTEPYQGMIPWNHDLMNWFVLHYRLVNCSPDCVYARTTPSAGTHSTSLP